MEKLNEATFGVYLWHTKDMHLMYQRTKQSLTVQLRPNGAIVMSNLFNFIEATADDNSVLQQVQKFLR